MRKPALSQSQKSKIKSQTLWRGLLSLFFMAAVLGAVFTGLLGTGQALAANGNQEISFQGKIVNKSDGTNITDGTYAFTFKIYDAASGGNMLWSETQSSVSLTSGIFQVQLGSVTSLSGIDFTNPNLWLDVTFNGETFGSRVQLNTVPYAVSALNLDGVVATQSATGFSLNGGTSSYSTVSFTSSGATLTMQPGSSGGLTLQSNGANALTLDTGGAAGVNIGATANAITFGATNNPTYSFNGTGAVTFQGTNFTLGNGSSATVQTKSGTNAGLTFLSSGTGSITLGQNSGLGNVVIAPNAGGQAALMVEDFGKGDLFTASAGATTKFVIDKSGQVGIGQAVPTALLDVEGTVNGTNGNGPIAIVKNSGSGDIAEFFNSGGLKAFVTNSGSFVGNGLYDSNYNSTGEFICVSSCGNQSLQLGGQTVVGANSVLTPRAMLDVRIPTYLSSVGTQPIAYFSGSTSNAGLVVDNTGGGDILTASASGTTRFTVKNDGTVVIGGNDTGTPNAVTIRGSNASTSDTNGANLTLQAGNGTGVGNSGDIIFQTATGANAPITLDSAESANDGAGGAANTFSWSHTTSSGLSNAILLVGVTLLSSGTGNSQTRSVQSITYGAQSLSPLSQGQVACPAVVFTSSCDVEVWYLKAPNAGTNTITVTLAGGATSNFDTGAATIYNVDQTTPFGTTTKNTGSNTNASVTVTGTNTMQTVFDYAGADNNIGGANAGQTQLWSDTTVWKRTVASTKPGAASSTSMGWTVNSADWVDIGVPLNPVANTAPATLVDRLHITSSGSVGIGTAAPLSQSGLDIEKNSAGNATLVVNQLDGGDIFTASASGKTQFVLTNKGTAVLGAGVTAANALPQSGLTIYDNGLGNALLDVNQLGSGDIFTASSSGMPVFKIDNAGNTRIVASLCVKATMSTACAGSTAGTIYATNTTLQSADYAENYISSQSLEPGELIVPANDGNNQAVLRSTSAYASQLLGVVSTNPGVTLNSDAQADALHPNIYPIALSGRVPVKVSTENGPIAVGDPLTSSSTPGVAMKATKAGPTIGYALDGYNGSGIGSIMLFVKLGYYTGAAIAGLPGLTFTPGESETAMDAATLSYMLQSANTNVASPAPASQIFTDRIVASLGVVTPTLTADTIYAHKIHADEIDGLQIFTNQLSALQNEVATQSGATIGQTTVLGAATASGRLTLDSLLVNGVATVSADLRVKGNSLIEGVLSVVDTLMTQNLVVNGLTNFLGSVVFHSNVTFQAAPVFPSNSAGFAIIQKGADHVDVTFTTPYVLTPVIGATITDAGAFAPTPTPTQLNDLQQTIFGNGYAYIITNVSPNGFRIQLNKLAVSAVGFSWNALLVPTPTVFESQTVSASSSAQ